MFSQKQKFVGSLLVAAAAWAHASPTQFFGAEGDVVGVVTAPLIAERARFLALFDNTVQSYGFQPKEANTSPPFDVLFNGSAGNTIKATLAGSSGQKVMDAPEAGRFNTTPNLPDGEPGKYWRVNASGSGQFSITFDRAISAFGFYGTDIGDFGGILSLVLKPWDVTLPLETLVVRPQTTSAAANGLALFYGFANASRAYSSISFVTSGTLLDNANSDYFGFDDFVVADAGQFLTPPTTGIPEPGSLALAGLALLAAGFAGKARKASQGV